MTQWPRYTLGKRASESSRGFESRLLRKISYNKFMKDCKLAIKINRSASDVFQFTLEPKNTPLWIDSIVKEEINEVPIKVGMIYRNVNKENVWSEYIVTKYEKGKVFEFVSRDKNYHVRYTFVSKGDRVCELEYFEWVENGELENTFNIKVLEKLKSVLEI